MINGVISHGVRHPSTRATSVSHSSDGCPSKAAISSSSSSSSSAPRTLATRSALYSSPSWSSAAIRQRQSVDKVTTSRDSPGHHNHHYAPNTHSPHPSIISRSKAVSSSPSSLSTDARKLRHTMATTNTTSTSSSRNSSTVACDNSPSSVHSFKPSFSSTSSVNYIQLNKLRIQQAKLRKPDLANAAGGTAFGRAKPTTCSSSAKVTSHGVESQSSAKVANSVSSLSQSSSRMRIPVVLSRSAFSSPLLTGSRSSNSPSSRPIVTRINAQDWINANSNKKDQTTRNRTDPAKSVLVTSTTSRSSNVPTHDRVASKLSAVELSSPIAASTAAVVEHQQNVIPVNSQSNVTKPDLPGNDHPNNCDHLPVQTPDQRHPTLRSTFDLQEVNKLDQTKVAIYCEPEQCDLKQCDDEANHNDRHSADGSSNSGDTAHPVPNKQSLVLLDSANDHDSGQSALVELTTLNDDVHHKSEFMKRTDSIATTIRTVTGERTVIAVSNKPPPQLSSCDVNSSGSPVKGTLEDQVRSNRSNGYTNTATTTDDAKSTKTDRSQSDLLAFIERSSPELLFLLNESAKLSYQLCQFELKLDYLEQIFVNGTHKDGADSDDDGLLASSHTAPLSWAKAIGRTREWINSARKKNIFMTKVDLKTKVTDKQFQTASKVLEKFKALSSDSKRFGSLLNLTQDQQQRIGDRDNVQQNSESLSSEDELIILLDRIAQFSANILKRKSDQQSEMQSKGKDEQTTHDQPSDFHGDLYKSGHSKSQAVNKPIDMDSILLEHKRIDSKNASTTLHSMSHSAKKLLAQLLGNDFCDDSPLSSSFNMDGSLLNFDLERICALEPEILKALSQIVQTKVRLVQVQREFDILMCAHLKSIGQSMTDRDKKCGSHSEFAGTSLPLSFTATKHQHQQSQLLRRAKPCSNASMTAKWSSPSCKHLASHPSQSYKTPKTLLDGNGNLNDSFGDAKSQHQQLNCCGNFVSDGDSGGEFTATTVTNDFNQCVTDDELSSLLNQIALCSQKIIEQSASTSSNSTTSSGCCCSTSIDAKCGGACSIGGHHNFNGHLRSLNNKDMSHCDLVSQAEADAYAHRTAPTQTSTGWAAHLSEYCCDTQQCLSTTANNRQHRHFAPSSTSPVNFMSKTSLPKLQQSQICCQSCQHSPPNHYGSNVRSQLPYDNLHHQLAEQTNYYSKRHSFSSPSRHLARKQPNRWSMGSNVLDTDLMYQDGMFYDLNTDCYSRGLNSGTGSGVHKLSHSHLAASTSHEPLGGWPLNEPFMDCIGNNVTNFMLSSSAVDVFSPLSSQHHRHPSHQHKHQSQSQHYSHHQHSCSGDPSVPPPTQPFPMGSSVIESNTNTSAFIFDPNVDVESFLSEVEKELDDNCFSSAPPFLTRANCRPTAVGGGARFGHEYSGSGACYGGTADHHPSHLLNQQLRSCHHQATPSYSTPLVNGPNLAMVPPSYTSLNASAARLNPNVNTSQFANDCHNSQTMASLLGGGNWRLTQRHSMLDLEHAVSSPLAPNSTTNHSHFPFPAMTSMPIASSATAASASAIDSQRYRRLAVPSTSRDLLDKFRAQVSNRVTKETDNQLREIDQWLHEQLQQSSARFMPSASDQSRSTGDYCHPSHQLSDHEALLGGVGVEEDTNSTLEATIHHSTSEDVNNPATITIANTTVSNNNSSNNNGNNLILFGDLANNQQ